MIFTLDDKVVYQIYGNPNNLGFDFDVGEYDKIKNISKEKVSLMSKEMEINYI